MPSPEMNYIQYHRFYKHVRPDERTILNERISGWWWKKKRTRKNRKKKGRKQRKRVKESAKVNVTVCSEWAIRDETGTIDTTKTKKKTIACYLLYVCTTVKKIDPKFVLAPDRWGCRKSIISHRLGWGRLWLRRRKRSNNKLARSPLPLPKNLIISIKL